LIEDKLSYKWVLSKSVYVEFELRKMIIMVNYGVNSFFCFVVKQNVVRWWWWWWWFHKK